MREREREKIKEKQNTNVIDETLDLSPERKNPLQELKKKNWGQNEKLERNYLRHRSDESSSDFCAQHRTPDFKEFQFFHVSSSKVIF